MKTLIEPLQMGAVSFIETMDHTSLSNITQEEFEQNVEEAIQNLPPSPSVTPATPQASSPDYIPEPPKTPSAAPAPGEESASALQMPTPASVAEDTRKFLQRTGTLAQQTISKPLNAIGKILSDALDGIDDEPGRRKVDAGQWNHPGQYAQYAQQGPQTPQGGTRPQPIQAPYKARVRHGSGTPSPSHTPINAPSVGPPALPARTNDLFAPYSGTASSLNERGMRSRSPSPNVPPRDLQEEIGAIEDAHRQAARETIVQIFPHVEGEVIDMVLEANGGDLGRTIDALLEISSS
jgi:Rab5 GDP/GTP exchange factor